MQVISLKTGLVYSYFHYLPAAGRQIPKITHKAGAVMLGEVLRVHRDSHKMMQVKAWYIEG